MASEGVVAAGEEPRRGRLRAFVGRASIAHLLIVIFALHLLALSFPSDTSNGGGRVFDESYYVPASLDLLHGVASNLEHPFFGKVWGALGIAIFGNDFFGWRIFYAIVGTLAVWLTYELARQFFSKSRALFAASMLAFENLFFVHTSLLLLDGPPILFALAGFLAYFKRRYYLSAVAFGLCILSKETGAFFLLALGLYHLWAHSKKVSSTGLWTGFRRIATFLLIVLLVVSVPLEGYDLAYNPHVSATVVIEPTAVVNPNTNVTTTTTYTTTSYAGLVTNPFENYLFYFAYQSSFKGCGSVDAWNCYPWSWILPFNVGPLPYYVTGKTVSAIAANGTIVKSTVRGAIEWVGMGNLVVWYSIWLVVPVLVWKSIKRKAGSADALVGCLIAGTYLPLFYISLVSGRVEYAFYFIDTDVGLALGIPTVVSFISGTRTRVEWLLTAAWLVAAVVFFLAYFPVNPFALMS